MPPGDTARQYHRLTSYAPDREWTDPVDDPLVLQDFVPNDLATWPLAYKAYADDLPRTELPREWPPVTTPAAAVLAGAGAPASTPATPDLAALARVLYLASGVVRVVERADRPTLLLRAAGSAGGRFPLELYVAARGVDGLDDGVHWYDPAAHALVAVGPAPAGETTTLVATGVPWRTGWRYSERAFRHVYWDAGTMLAQALLVAESGGLAPRLWTRFPDGQVTRLVGADGVHEWPVALVTLGDGAPAIEPGGDATTGAVDVKPPLEFPLITLAQHAGDGEELGEPWPVPPPLDLAPPASPDLDTVILQRGSTRLMDRSATVPRALLDFVLAAALRGTRVPHYIAAHGVEDLAPGLYRWPDMGHPVRQEPMRDELFHVCYDQGLGGDAAFVVMGTIDLATIDDRGYREAQLDAGLVEGRLHVAAYALGIGASGMTFLDSEIEGLLGEPLAALLFTCVGVPEYRNRRGGRPGAPVAVNIPMPRLD
jgi:SagB-type dehydrogenase family enzyme